MDADSGKIVGKPTLLVTFGNRLDAKPILDAIGALDYPLRDVSVYYRVAGTDQVLDAVTGQVAAGQALTDEDAKVLDRNALETLVLMHPNGEQFVAVQGALRQFGEADYKYAERTVAGSADNDDQLVNSEAIAEVVAEGPRSGPPQVPQSGAPEVPRDDSKPEIE
jgi:hypothetical protein